MTPKKIAILTDSCADLRPEFVEEHHVFVVPLRIRCCDGEYRDGVDIHSEGVYARLKDDVLPQTSLPSAADMSDTFQQIAEEGYDGVIAVMLSSGLSGTYNLTRLMGEEFEEAHAGRIAVRVYDSLLAAIAQGAVVMQLADDMERGMDWETLTERRVPYLLKNTHAYFSVNTLEYLQKGGRIGTVAAMAGTLMQIRPILSFTEDGRLTSVAKVRGRNRLLQKLVEMIEKDCGDRSRYNVVVVHGGAPRDREDLRPIVMQKMPDYDHLWEGEIGGTLSVHIGDGIVGIVVQALD